MKDNGKKAWFMDLENIPSQKHHFTLENGLKIRQMDLVLFNIPMVIYMLDRGRMVLPKVMVNTHLEMAHTTMVNGIMTYQMDKANKLMKVDGFMRVNSFLYSKARKLLKWV